MPTHTKIIKMEMLLRDMTLAQLANKLGLSNASRASDRVNRKNCTVKGLAELVEGVDCELLIRAKDGTEYVIKAEDYE